MKRIRGVCSGKYDIWGDLIGFGQKNGQNLKKEQSWYNSPKQRQDFGLSVTKYFLFDHVSEFEFFNFLVLILSCFSFFKRGKLQSYC